MGGVAATKKNLILYKGIIIAASILSLCRFLNPEVREVVFDGSHSKHFESDEFNAPPEYPPWWVNSSEVHEEPVISNITKRGGRENQSAASGVAVVVEKIEQTLNDDVGHHVTVHVGQSHVASTEPKRALGVINA